MNKQAGRQANRLIFRAWLFVAAMFLSLSVYAQTFVFVSSEKTKIFERANFESEVLVQVHKSTKLEVLEKKGIWYQVQHNNLAGWLVRYSVTTKQPLPNKVSIFSRIKNFFNFDNRRNRVSLVSTAGGIRGLEQGEVLSTGKTDLESLEKLEKMAITPEALEAFKNAGEQ